MSRWVATCRLMGEGEVAGEQGIAESIAGSKYDEWKEEAEERV